MKKFYLVISTLSVFISISAQEVKWQKDISSSTQDFLSGMAATIDRQILVFGSSINQKSAPTSTATPATNKGYDYHVLKLDQQGNKLWDKYFGGTRHDYLISAVATQEGGFLLAGTSFSNQSGDKKKNNTGGSDVWLVRLNENGEELWQQTLGTKSNDEASSVVQSSDQGFFVAGNISSNKQLFGSKDVFVSKIDKNGKLIRTSILGGKGLDEVQEIVPSKDGGVMVLIYSTSGKTEAIINASVSSGTNTNGSAQAGQEKSMNQQENAGIDILTYSLDSKKAAVQYHAKSEDSFGAGDYWIVKLDKDGNAEWQKTYGGSADDRPKSIALTDKGYLIAGESRSSSSGNKQENTKEGTDLWLISIDELGNEIWQKSYSFGNRDVAMSLDVIQKTDKNNFSHDNGFLIGGYTQAEERIQTDDEKFWMLYIGTDGKEQWRKHVEGKSNKKEERLVSAKLQRDGTYLLAGTSAEQLGEENWKIVKLDSKELENLAEKQDIRIYPNPVSDYAYVEIGFPLQANEEATIYLHDMTGRQVQTLKTRNQVTKINTIALPQGVYIVTASTQTKTVNTKIVKK
jgi:hypothetical protein